MGGAFSDEEIAAFESFLQNNAHFIFRYAATGGGDPGCPDAPLRAKEVYTVS